MRMVTYPLGGYLWQDVMVVIEVLLVVPCYSYCMVLVERKQQDWQLSPNQAEIMVYDLFGTASQTHDNPRCRICPDSNNNGRNFSALWNQPANMMKTRLHGVQAEYTYTWGCITNTDETKRVSEFYTGIMLRLSGVIFWEGAYFIVVNFNCFSTAFILHYSNIIIHKINIEWNNK